jgi:hypothetical protein
MGEVIVPLSVRTAANRICRNIGVLQTTVGELVTVEKHQRKFARNFNMPPIKP